MAKPPPDPALLEEQRAFLNALALALVRDQGDAEDVTQETMLAAVRTPPQGQNVRGWLSTVARNLALRVRRGRARRRRREERAARPEGVPSVEEAVARLEVQRRVTEAVLRLEEPYRTVVIQRFFYGLPPDEIARAQRIPRETVRTRLRRALDRLRADLDRQHGGRRSAWSLPLLGVPRTEALGVIAMSVKAKLSLALVLACLLVLWTGLHWTAKEPTRLRAMAGGRGGTIAEESNATSPPPPRPPDFEEIDRDRDLHGIVVRASDGLPIVGARLRAVTYPWQRSETLSADTSAVVGPTTVSGADGSFALRLRPGIAVGLRVVAEGFAPVELVSRQPGERVHVEMSPGVRLLVRALDESSRPVGGAHLHLFAPGLDRTGVTDERGMCILDALPVRMTATLESRHAELSDSGWRGVELPATGDVDVELLMPGGRTLSGRVTDGETGAAIEGAQVGLDFFLFRVVTTDADGRYTLNGWTPNSGRNAIHVVADGYGRAAAVVGDEDAMDFQLLRGDSVTGRLVDGSGRPVALAYVSAVASVRRGNGWESCARWGRSGDDGRFLISGLNRDLPHRLAVVAEGLAKLHLDVPPREREADIADLGEIVMEDSRTVAGRVRDSVGAPAARVWVTLTLSRSVAGQQTYERFEERWTDDLGRFRFTDLSAGSYVAMVMPPGGRGRERTIQLKGADLLDLEFQLVGGEEFVVTVRDRTGAPLGAACVILRTSIDSVEAETDFAGVARLHATGTPQSVEVLLPGRGRLPRRREEKVPAGATSHEIVMEEVDLVAGIVLDPDGTPLPGAWLGVWVGGRRVNSARTSEDGTFEAALPLGATCDLAVESVQSDVRELDRYRFRGRVEGIAAGTRAVELRTERVAQDRRLRVAVLLPDGTPAAGALVSAIRTVTADAHGVVTLEDLPDREITLIANPPKVTPGLTYRRVLVLPAGQAVELWLRRTVVISGVVLRHDGTPGAGSGIDAIQGGRCRYGTGTDAGGRFALEVGEDETGPFLLRARLDGRVTDPVEAFPGASGITLRIARD